MNVDIWDQAYKNQGALVVMALLLIFIAMSVQHLHSGSRIGKSKPLLII